MRVDMGHNAQVLLFQPILRHPKFHVTNQGTHPVNESLGKRLKTNKVRGLIIGLLTKERKKVGCQGNTILCSTAMIAIF